MKKYLSNQKILIGIGSVSGFIILAFILFFLGSNKKEHLAVRLEEEKLLNTRGIPHDSSIVSWDGSKVWRPNFLETEKVLQKSELATPKILFMEYQLEYRYPSDSRPLTKKMADLLDPFKINQEKVPIFKPDSNGEIQGYFSWFSSLYMVTEDKPAVAWLQVFDAKTDKPVRARILSAEIQSDLVFGEKPVGVADYNDSGAGYDLEANDGIYTFSWIPRKGEKLHWGELTMKVRFDAPSIKLKETEASFTFNSTPIIPAKFTGNYRESIENGSLLIGAEIDIYKPGQYIFEANLFDKETGTPYHWVYMRKYLEKGTSQRIDLPFFGAIFHDRGFEEGRFILRNLRGHRMNLPYDPRKLNEMVSKGIEIPDTFEPLQEWIPLPEEPYITLNRYDVAQFSPLEYQGSDKKERLRVLQDYAAAWEKAHGASTDTVMGD
ncbi:hypothetical protein [Leptospira perdikensis]|uniref:Uncharacterized protein n=1 Tax=Leptospira perdikensis TaxID=2484948 RepID=A0A4R9J4Q4_9LEPT|nr:hypothetical protein [Leptospira perdikensis]TGL33489.1 hypothetical protein EHQ49_17830 [Leptospira perdikensis]